jgi:hypothetical protein
VTAAKVLTVVDAGERLEFTLDDLMRYHGPHSPGGVAHAFKVLEAALPALAADGPCERRALTVRTAFGGPGARDGFELVTRAVTERRYTVDPALARPELGRARERFVFVIAHGDATATLVLRDGHVTDEFIDLARAPDRTPAQEARLTTLKRDMAERLAALSAAEVYDLTVEHR